MKNHASRQPRTVLLESRTEGNLKLGRVWPALVVHLRVVQALHVLGCCVVLLGGSGLFGAVA